MNKQKLLTVISSPLVSEKTARVADQDRQYVFKVVKTATKLEVKKAIELLFKVSVENVNVMNVKGKTRRTGRFNGRCNDWKKAYVKLAEGHEIQFAE